MKQFLTILLTASSIVALPALAEFDIKLNGRFHFESGFRHQNLLEEHQKLVSANKKGFAFYSDAYAGILVKNTLDTGITYGARMVLRTTSKSRTASSLNGSHIFLEADDVGKIELGSPYDAGSKMRVTASNISHSSGRWSAYAYLPKDIQFVTSNKFMIDSFTTNEPITDVIAEPPRKINFFTPKFKGFSFGISYIPDSSNGGVAKASRNVTSSIDNIRVAHNLYLRQELVVTNAFSGGITYEHNFNEYTGIKLALTGELGKSKSIGLYNGEEVLDNHEKKIVLNDKITDIPLHNLQAYNIGGIFTYKNLSCAASFGSLGKSFTNANIHGASSNSNFYNLAAAYEQGPVGVSISYFHSDFRGNRMNTVSFGTEYKIAPGLMPYFDITYFKGKGTPLSIINIPRNKKYSGIISVLGLKLQF